MQYLVQCVYSLLVFLYLSILPKADYCGDIKHIQLTQE
nr:MAG TPA: hypothetical protein [Caudoviricetes sp.]